MRPGDGTLCCGARRELPQRASARLPPPAPPPLDTCLPPADLPPPPAPRRLVCRAGAAGGGGGASPSARARAGAARPARPRAMGVLRRQAAGAGAHGGARRCGRARRGARWPWALAVPVGVACACARTQSADPCADPEVRHGRGVHRLTRRHHCARAPCRLSEGAWSPSLRLSPRTS